MTILIVDDFPVFSMGIQSIIKSEFPNAHILQTDTLNNAITLLSNQPVDMMVLDASVVDGKDTNLLRTFKQNSGASVIVYLGEQLAYMYPFIRAGANGLFSKKSTASEICEGMKTLMNNLTFISHDIQQFMLAYLVSNKANVNKELTRKEYQMADLLATNKSRIEIAVIAGVTPQTVTLYKRTIFNKLNVHNIVELNIKLNKLTLAQ